MSKEEHLHLELEMLQSKFQASEPSGSEEEFFNIFSVYFYCSDPGPSEAGPVGP